MVFAGQRPFCFVYDPETADWVEVKPKPAGMVYNACFFTLTLCSTPSGVIAWTAHGRIFRYAKGEWSELKLRGEKLPGSVVDNSTVAYDSNRNRVLFFRKPYGKTPYNGQLYALDLESGVVRALSLKNITAGSLIRGLDRCCYDLDNDIVLFATRLADKGTKALMPAYDCSANRWISLSISVQ